MCGKILDKEKHERKKEEIKKIYKKYEWIEREKKILAFFSSASVHLALLLYARVQSVLPKLKKKKISNQ